MGVHINGESLFTLPHPPHQVAQALLLFCDMATEQNYKKSKKYSAASNYLGTDLFQFWTQTYNLGIDYSKRKSISMLYDVMPTASITHGSIGIQETLGLAQDSSFK